jgi:hypothetical protein
MNSSWRSAVELYTSLKLTRETDRLAAFHGFTEFYAPLIASNTERDCIFELWKGSLHLDLLWRVELPATFNMDARCLCRCWDTEIVKWENRPIDRALLEHLKQRNCQYSYPAACSEACLAHRRLCRYGTQSAAIRVGTDIEGLSCVDWHHVNTNVRKLQLYEKTRPKVHELELPHAPSWSWASTHQSVKYWTDVRYDLRSEGGSHRCKFDLDEEAELEEGGELGEEEDRAVAEYSMDEDQVNEREEEFEVAESEEEDEVDNTSCSDKLSGVKASGYLVPAILKYQDMPVPDSIDHKPDSNRQKWEVLQSHDILKYGLQVKFDSADLDFHPDWILSLDGPKFIPNNTGLFLFHVTGSVYLVLKEKWFFSRPCHERVGLSHYRKKRSQVQNQTARGADKDI